VVFFGTSQLRSLFERRLDKPLIPLGALLPQHFFILD